jgi:hypothetical protein
MSKTSANYADWVIGSLPYYDNSDSVCEGEHIDVEQNRDDGPFLHDNLPMMQMTREQALSYQRKNAQHGKRQA